MNLKAKTIYEKNNIIQTLYFVPTVLISTTIVIWLFLVVKQAPSSFLSLFFFFLKSLIHHHLLGGARHWESCRPLPLSIFHIRKVSNSKLLKLGPTTVIKCIQVWCQQLWSRNSNAEFGLSENGQRITEL